MNSPLLAREFARYFWAGVEYAGLHYTLAKVVATGAVFVVNFAMKKAVLFR